MQKTTALNHNKKATKQERDLFCLKTILEKKIAFEQLIDLIYFTLVQTAK